MLNVIKASVEIEFTNSRSQTKCNQPNRSRNTPQKEYPISIKVTDRIIISKRDFSRIRCRKNKAETREAASSGGKRELTSSKIPPESWRGIRMVEAET